MTLDHLDKAISLHKQGDFLNAEKAYLNSRDKDNLNSVNYLLGLLYSQTNRFIPGIHFLESVFFNQKNNPEIYNALAINYQQLGKTRTALRLIDIAIKLNPAVPNYYNRKCKILLQLHRFSMATETGKFTLKKFPGFKPIHITLSECWKHEQRPDNAARVLNTALRHFPGDQSLMFNLADSYIHINQLTKARHILTDLLNSNYHPVECLVNLAVINREENNLPQSISQLTEAISLDKENQLAKWNLGIVYLLSGKWREGWRYYEYGSFAKIRNTANFKQKLWKGESLAGKSLLVSAEQGIGDEIMFASFVPLLREMASKLTLTCHPRLLPLFRASFKKCCVISHQELNRKLVNHHDYCISSGSILQHIPENHLPQAKPFLLTDLKSLKKDHSPLKVGISWRGGKQFKDIRKRSTHIRQWPELFKGMNCEIYSLQHHLQDQEKNTLNRSFLNSPIHFVDTNNLLNLAKSIKNLDLVLSVDNTIAHLAGALGIPTLCLLPRVPDWRWGIERPIYNWYPSITFFRQPSPGDWASVFSQINRYLLQHYR